MPTDTIDRELCLALNLYAMCDGKMVEHYGMDRYWKCEKCDLEWNSDRLSGNHWKDGKTPPNLLSDSGFVLLRNALLDREYWVTSYKTASGYYCSLSLKWGTLEWATGPDEKAALRAAAHSLLCPKEKIMSDETRYAPIQMPHHGHLPHGIQYRVPWRIHLKAWEQYARLGHGSQSAERLAERGGFGLSELIILLAGEDPYSSIDNKGERWATHFFGKWEP